MEPVFHLLLPPITLMALFPKLDKSLIIKLSLLSVVMDLDTYLPFIHRIAFHNLFFVALVAFLLWKFIGTTAAGIGSYMMLSHLVFDSGFPGNALFWPVIPYLFYLTVNVTYTYDLGWIWDMGGGILPLEHIAPAPQHYITTEGFLYAAFVAIILALVWWRRNKHAV